MAEKKKTPAKAAPTKAAPTKAAPAKSAAKAPAKASAKATKAAAKKPVKGTALACETCGMAVVVDEVCGCVEVHEIICCGVPMKLQKEKTVKVKVK